MLKINKSLQESGKRLSFVGIFDYLGHVIHIPVKGAYVVCISMLSFQGTNYLVHSFIHFLVGLVPLLIRGRHSGINSQLVQQVFTQRMPFQPQPISGKHPHTHSHKHSYTTDNLAYPIHLYRMSLDCGGNRSTRRKPTWRQGEHANSTQKRQLSQGSRFNIFKKMFT